MRSVGQVLKEEREKKFYSLEEIEKATKIRRELLEALEKGEYLKLPPTTFIQGFIKNYAKFLGLNPEKLLAIFRREFAEAKHPPRILESFADPIDKKIFKLTPARVLGGLVVSLVIIFFVYLWFEYRFLTLGPYLEIDKPVDQESFSLDTIQVIGRTDPEAKITINNQEIGVDLEGKFVQEIKLSDGMNSIAINAVSKGGKATKIEKTVFFRR